MLPVVALSVFLLVTAGVYLVMQRSLLRVALGLSCVSHGVNLLLLSSGRWAQNAPIVREGLRVEDVSDPVPQAFVLTAIVISMSFTIFLLAGTAIKTRRGGIPEVIRPPEADADRPPAELRAELEGRGGEDGT